MRLSQYLPMTFRIARDIIGLDQRQVLGAHEPVADPTADQRLRIGIRVQNSPQLICEASMEAGPPTPGLAVDMAACAGRPSGRIAGSSGTSSSRWRRSCGSRRR